MVQENTTIKISAENWQKLNAMKKKPGESFDDALDRCLDAKERLEHLEEIGEITREALEE